MNRPPAARLRLAIRGAVQGVGFRPFVHHLAAELQLAGWVNNGPQGVSIEVEGARPQLESFLLRIAAENPPRSFIQSLEASWLDPLGFTGFEIRASEVHGDKTALVLPDVATCSECLREIFDPANRRFRYPFTNCTHCGPRFSIIESLPYDRANTVMKSFVMCPQCQAEYDDPGDRRFHAQPNACPVCGPRLQLLAPKGEAVCSGHQALLETARLLRAGSIVAVKGLGGFHLMVDARREEAVRRLRERKHREEKPLATLFPSLESVQALCEVSPLEQRLLSSPEAPIVLLKKLASCDAHVTPSVAPGNPNLGVMLPSNPLQHLLLAELNFPVVATSGNLTDEPICTSEEEALERLQGIADAFLAHNRPIVRHVDDSIVRVMLDRELVLRRARGFAPLPVLVRGAAPGAQKVLGVGAHLKNAVALGVGDQVFISQHIGDLETEQAHAAFRRVIADFEKLYETKPEIIAADLHPDYLSTQFAQKSGIKHVGVQHHLAHVLSCMAENELPPPVLGVAWDGTGYGLDGSIWGGEFFLVTHEKAERVAQLLPFRLPGGDKAVKEPRRAAAGLLHEMFGPPALGWQDLAPIAAFSPAELAPLKVMLARGVNSPWCSSVGRLFDAVASLVNLRQQNHFEGQAAMALEFMLEGIEDAGHYEFPLVTQDEDPPLLLDWSPTIAAILGDLKSGASVGEISARFHAALTEAIVETARRLGQSRVVLSGGCFQNRYLTQRTVTRLREEKFQPYWHQRVPPNDGGIALGQVVAVRRQGG